MCRQPARNHRAPCRAIRGKITRRRGHAASRCGREHALQRERAVEARALLTDLGPTFIKFGQMLSIRPDVLPPPAVYELQKLCDSVPSYLTPHALELIESELGQPASELFDQLAAETEPIAAASLGQVYKCTSSRAASRLR